MISARLSNWHQQNVIIINVGVLLQPEQLEQPEQIIPHKINKQINQIVDN